MVKITLSCSSKVAQKYYCEKCDYNTCKKSSWDKHQMSRKHLHGNFMVTNDNKKVAHSSDTYTCSHCNTFYTHPSGLSRHKKICKKLLANNKTGNHVESNVKIDKDDTIKEMKGMIYTLVTQNKDMQKMIRDQNNTIVELSKNAGYGGNNTMNHSHNHTNSHNKTFNLQFFLNETCKDAMNITDFVNSLKLTLQDLEQVGELGYAEGISRMFVKGLNDLEVTKRPIHCSDLKRETLHIKDKDKWEKDNPAQDRLKKAIKDLSNKNIMLLDDWQKENPGCKEYDNRKNDIYLKMMVESLGPANDIAEKRDFGKIIRTIAKNTIIDKDTLETR
jgi:hypothetical protein